MAKEETERKNVKIVITFRIFQAICFGLTALGLSSVIGDISSYAKSPVSNFSIVTTIFGLIGSLITEKLARDAEKW